ncbi:signal peptide peptidase SppA [soil metagenome]
MLQFLKFVLATFVGLSLFFMLTLFLLFGIAAVASRDQTVTLDQDSILELKLDKPIEERSVENPFANVPLPFGQFQNNLGLDEILKAIRRAKNDNRIKGIHLYNENVSAGMATVEEIRRALLDFKESGKFIVAYSEVSSEKAYYLNSVADRIYLNPSGLMEFNGLSSEIVFFKGTFDKLGIQPYVFRVGEFKSAVEPFIQAQMSESNRQQTQSFLSSLHDHALGNIAQSRNLTVAQLRNISDSLKVTSAEDALRNGLVTHLGYYDQVLDYFREQLGEEDATKKPNVISLSRYKKVASDEGTSTSRNRIAVIYASGDIVGGEGGEGSIGGTKYAEAIRKVRLDDNVKAVVLRINSPGGSALASDIIWREVELTKAVKPVIASMSDLAASGGYYIAMACDTIVAHPNTITGSIGVFGMLFNTEPFLREKLGITIDRVKTGRYADMPTVTRPLTDFERQVLQKETERIYEDFTRKAAQGRRITQDQLKQYASGRVWSGIEAKERGLIDVLGSLDDAIQIAAAKANLGDNYRIRSIPERKTFLEEFMTGLRDGVQAKALRQDLGALFPYYEAYKKVEGLQGIQARLPYNLTVE